jgi:hypothetical protein
MTTRVASCCHRVAITAILCVFYCAIACFSSGGTTHFFIALVLKILLHEQSYVGLILIKIVYMMLGKRIITQLNAIEILA